MHAPLVNRVWRYGTLVLVAVASLAVLMALPPMRQDPHYHDFADKRCFLGIPNFADVVSNLPFLFVGLAGLVLGRRGRLAGFSRSWFAFFTGVALVSVGSGYYHWRPCDDTLVWDRLPMTAGFMALFAALLGESVHVGLDRVLLVPFLLLGIASVVYWHVVGDLRFYAWVQYAPLLMIPALLVLFPGRYSHRSFLWTALGCYLIAKLFEALDRQIFALSHGIVAGHAIKHLWAATGCWVILEMLRKRKATELNVV